MDVQGGDDRYGAMEGQNNMLLEDKPRQATAAQLAKRKILQAKGKGSARSSRQGSPAFGPPQSTNPFQSFSTPPFASDFNFSMPGAPTAPSFGGQQNETPSFGGFSNTQNNNNTSFTFGGTSNTQSQPNGFNSTPSFSFGQSQNTPSTPSTSFSFGQNQSQMQPKTNGFQSNATFGFSGQQSQPQQNGLSTTLGFGQDDKTSQSHMPSFGSFGQQQQPTESTHTSTTGLFGSKPLTNSDSTVKSGQSIFSGLNSQNTGLNAGMFTKSQANGEETPKASNPFASFASQPKEQAHETFKPAATFTFGQQNQTNGVHAANSSVTGFNQQPQVDGEQTVKATTFSGFNFGQPTEKQVQSEHNNQPPQPASPIKLNMTRKEEPPKTSSSLFSQTQSTAATPLTLGGPQHEDTSMASPGNTPQKQSAVQSSTEPETSNSSIGRSLFERMSTPATNTTSKPTFSFKPSSPPNGSALVTSNQLFPPSQPAATPATIPTPSLSTTGNSRATATNLISVPTTSHPPATPRPAPAQLPAQITTSSSQSSLGSVSNNYEQLKELNEGLLAHLKTEDPARDWSVIFEYYMSEAARILGKATSKTMYGAQLGTPSNAGANASSASANQNGRQAPHTVSGQNTQPSELSKVSASSEVPATSSAANIFSQPVQAPATAPVNKKSGVEEVMKDNEQTPEKRPNPNERIEYPKLPENSSKTAQLFASTLEKAEKSNPVSSTNTFNPSTTFKFGMPKTVEPTTNRPAETLKVPTFGFTPSSTSSQSAGFQPTTEPAASGSTNFLSAFGQKANQEQEKKRKARMDEEYDSEDEDQAAWEARDREEQEAKKRRIEEAAKNAPVFQIPNTMGKSSSSAPFAFKLPGSDKPAGDSETLNAGKSFFERVGPKNKSTDEEAATSTAQPTIFSEKSELPKFTPSTFSFGQSNTTQSDKANGEKKQGPGDKSWNPNTPIKFGEFNGKETTTPAAAPPANPFAGLFGSSTASATKLPSGELTKLAPPVGFNFGAPKVSSTDVSRATTPGVTTDGEVSTADTADGHEAGDEQNDPQVEDMTALLPEERANEDVLFEVAIAKAMVFDEKKTEDGTVRAFVEKGKGPLYILKNKATGKTRVLLKIPPLGRPAMNFPPVSRMEYKAASGAKTVMGPFVDHMETSKDKVGKLSQWRIQVKEPKDAQEIARILTEEGRK